MKKILKALSLTLILAAPVGLPVSAENSGRGAQAWQQTWQLARQQFPGLQVVEVCEAKPDQKELDAFFNSRYTYWDAKVLAGFWHQTLTDTKMRMGRKIAWGPEAQTFLETELANARHEALKTVDQLRFYSDSGYTYDDAEALANFWGEKGAYEAKSQLCINFDQSKRHQSIGEPYPTKRRR